MEWLQPSSDGNHTSVTSSEKNHFFPSQSDYDDTPSDDANLSISDHDAPTHYVDPNYVDFAAKAANYVEDCDFDSALTAYGSALEKSFKEVGPDDLYVAKLYINRADVYMKIFDFDLAIEDYKNASTIRMDQLNMKDSRVIQILRKLSHAMEQQHIQGTETDLSTKFYKKKTDNLKASIDNLMIDIEVFMEDFENEMGIDHNNKSEKNLKRASSTNLKGSMPDLFHDFEDKLDVELDIAKFSEDISNRSVEPDVVM